MIAWQGLVGCEANREDVSQAEIYEYLQYCMLKGLFVAVVSGREQAMILQGEIDLER